MHIALDIGLYWYILVYISIYWYILVYIDEMLLVEGDLNVSILYIYYCLCVRIYRATLALTNELGLGGSAK